MDIAEHVISEQECWHLLATASVGRLAVSVRALPMILPVQYYLDNRNITACLGHHELPERSLNEAIIAFAADSIDPRSRAGWSVEIQGRSVIPLKVRFDTACGRPTAGQVVRIEPATITGHWVQLCPFIDAMLSAGTSMPTKSSALSSGKFRNPSAAAGRDLTARRPVVHPVKSARGQSGPHWAIGAIGWPSAAMRTLLSGRRALIALWITVPSRNTSCG